MERGREYSAVEVPEARIKKCNEERKPKNGRRKHRDRVVKIPKP